MNHAWLRSMCLAASCSIASFAAAGCYSEAEVQYPGDDDGQTDLVEVSPGVEVIADWEEPIFFADNWYWVNRGGVWYRSGWYRGGWVAYGDVPVGIRGISNPGIYVHYRPAGWAAHEHVAGGYNGHVQYHQAHAAGGVHIRAAVHGGGHR